MVFARTKLVINENVFPHKDSVEWNFPIRDNKEFYEDFKEMVIGSFGVDESQIQEVELDWDKSDNIKTKWIITKELDDISYVLITVKLKVKKGNVSVKVQPIVKTEYPQDSIFQKTVFYEIGRMLADKVFYEKKKMQYLAEMQRDVKKFQKAVKRYSTI